MDPELIFNFDLLKNEKTQLQEKLTLLEHLLDFVPAIINIHEYPDITRPSYMRNIWANRCSLDFIGYTREEIDNLGYNMGESVISAEDKILLQDVSTVDELMNHLCTKPKRFRTKDGSYKWVQTRGKIYQHNTNGLPLLILFVAFELPNNFSLTDTSNFQHPTYSADNFLFQLPTTRERDILKLITRGFTDKEIAEQLFISVKTAQTHRNNLIKKLGVKNTAALVAFAISNGLY